MNEPSVNRFEKVVSGIAHSLKMTDVVAASLISQALSSCIAVTNTPTEDWDTISALLCSIDPRNALEACLAIQLVGVHYQTVALLSKAAKCDFLDTKEHYLKVAVKLSKHYVGQVEALKRLRSKGEQRMVVEHVNIHSGAQAVVGQLDAPRGGEK